MSVELLSPYNDSIYQNLPDIDSVITTKVWQGEDFQVKVLRLLEVIHNYDLQDLVALVLLHKHFPLEEQARLCHTFDTTGNKVVEIATVDDRGKESIPIVFSISGGTWFPLEFAMDPSEQVQTGWKATASTLAANEPFLRQFSDLLHEMNCTNVFGVASAFLGPIKPSSPSEMLLEKTFITPNKMLVTERVPRISVKEEDIIPTMWFASDNLPGSQRGCFKYCVYIRTCQRSGGGHVSVGGHAGDHR